MLKLIYLAKRRPGFTPDEFTRRWRMHGARGMSTSFWRHALGYVQAEPIRPVPIAGASDEYDAIAILIVKEDTFTAPPILPDDADAGQFMLNDEKETFAAPIPSVSLWVHEEHLKAGALGGTTAFLFFRDAAKAREVAAALHRNDDRVIRLTLNTKRDDEALGSMENTLPYEAIVEISAIGITELKSALEPVSDAANIGADVCVVTREAVLWDRVS